MSTPSPQGEHDRPLTRRELRELADKQARDAQAASAASAASTGYRNRQAQPAAPSPGTFGGAGQTLQQQSRTAPAMPHTGVQPQRVSYGTAPTMQPSQFSAANTRSAERPAPNLEPRAIVEPHQDAVQVTRRSMYSQAPAAGVPHVTPPAQASAVRLLEETGTISKLVDPKAFEAFGSASAQESSRQSPQTPGPTPAPTQNAAQAFPARQSMQPSSRMSSSTQQRAHSNPQNTSNGTVGAQAGTGAQTASGVHTGRSNLSGYMRQAPPSSQIPRVEQDASGNWVASSGAAVADRSDRPLLPSWNANDLPFASISAASAASVTSEPEYEPTQGFTNGLSNGTGLPARGLAGHQAASPQQGHWNPADVQAGYGAPAQTPFGTSGAQSFAGHPVARPEQFETPQFGAPSANQQALIEPHSVAPAWDAITSRNSSLPQDPTRGGVSIESVMTGQQQVVDSTRPVSGFSSTSDFESEPAPASFAPQAGSQEAAPSINAFQDSGPTLTTQEDEEEFELDHSYTWLHYLILVAVAFVLGMIIWKVGLDSAAASTQDDQPADAAMISQIVPQT